MEEKYDKVLKHDAHWHLLILNENYVAKEGDVCFGCREEIDSCKSSFVYSCSNITGTTTDRWCSKFFLHKTCAEVPRKIEDPINQKDILVFQLAVNLQCDVCFQDCCRFYYINGSKGSCVCLKCVVSLSHQSKEDPLFEHPGHKHPLALIEQPSSFKCYVCKVNDNTLASSYRCTKCQFWIHKSCGDAPRSFQFVIHKHPLIFSSSLPPQHRGFPQRCRLCNERLNLIDWLYYCGSCRYFTHFACTRSSSVFSFGGIETCPDLVQLPVEDESSLNLLLEKFMEDYNNNNNYSMVSPTKSITHWAHEEHDLKLVTIDELYERKHSGEVPLLCDGCVKPIRTDEGQSYYACFPCKFLMHKVCAELPREIEHHLWPGKKLYANKYSEPFKFFWCRGCSHYGNGIFYRGNWSIMCLDIGCVTLPKSIKHVAHPHQLNHFFQSDQVICNACGLWFSQSWYKCEKCRFTICGRCVRKARTYKHRWDPHPLDLIYDAGMVEEHEHEFDCEFCSQIINPNNWFYHCSKCDLSFHTYCIEHSSYGKYQNVKFGATDITRKLHHPHRLTFVLNKKVRRCMNCKENSLGKPVLQCAPCNSTIFCYRYNRGWCGPVW